MNDMDELLVIKEKYTGIEARWKFPGGGADTGVSQCSTLFIPNLTSYLSGKLLNISRI